MAPERSRAAGPQGVGDPTPDPAFPPGLLAPDERMVYSVRPRWAAFAGVGPVLFLGLALLGLALLIEAWTPGTSYETYLQGPNGIPVEAPQFFDTVVVILAGISGIGALLWRHVAQPVRLGLGVLAFFAVPYVFVGAYVYVVPSGASNFTPPTGPPPVFNGSAASVASDLPLDLWVALGIAAALAFLLVVVVPMGSSFFTWKRTRYAMTDRRLIATTGMVGRFVRDARLSEIRDVTTDQGILGRSMDYGDVIFSTSSGGASWWGLRSGRHGLGIAWLGVPSPYEVRRHVFEITDDGTNGRTVRTPPAT